VVENSLRAGLANNSLGPAYLARGR
jgi:hypothetical protein